MSKTATATEHSEDAGPLAADPAGPANARRAVALVAVVGLAHLPLLLGHVYGLWLYRPHYDVYPLLAVGMAGAFWSRGPRFSGLARPAWWATGLLAGGLAALTIGLLLGSPWWAAVATVLSAGGLLGRYAIPEPDRSWLPAWLLLWLIVPLPFDGDVVLLGWLQSTSLQAASGILDLLGVRHVVEGQVLVLPERRLLAEEIGLGLPALPLLLALTALAVTLDRFPVLWGLLLLAGSVAWAWLANAARVASMVLGQQWYRWDLTSGWAAVAVTWGTGLLALMLLASTNRGLAFLLRPIAPRRGAMALPSASRRNPLNRVWNWLVGASEPAAGTGRHGRSSRHGSSTSVSRTRQAERRAPATGVLAQRSVRRGRDAGWLVAFGLLGTVQLAWFALFVLAGGPGSGSPSPVDKPLPAALADWTLEQHERQVHRRGAPSGRFSNEFRYVRGTRVCEISVRGPVPDGQDPTLRLRAVGWHPTLRRVAGGGPGDEAASYLEIEVSTPAGEYGWLLSGQLDSAGEAIPAADGVWASTRNRLVRGPLGCLVRGQCPGSLASPTYWIQAFVSGVSPTSPDERAEIRRLFVAARSQIRRADLPAQPAEDKP